MVLACPPDDYNAESAFKILKCFSEKDLLSGLEILKQNGTVSKHRVQPDARPVPGLPARGINLNEKFVSFFNRHLPDDFFKHAIAYRRKVMNDGEISRPQESSSGSFAALYDLVIARNVNIQPIIPSLEYSTEEKESCKSCL
jgi:hypothetical protein